MHHSFPPNHKVYFEQVWNLVRQIPYGKVATYGQIAQMIPLPEGVDFEEYKTSSSRWVGGAMAACPEGVPWQRVINSQGKISKRPSSEKQRHLLEEEGVLFVGDKLDLKVYQWQSMDQQNEPRQGTLF